MKLSEISERIGAPHDVTRGKAFYDLYEDYFAALIDQAITLLELGVETGESLRVFATYFRQGWVIGVDNVDRGTDFSAYPNIVFALADQRSSDDLDAICETYAPDGLDIVIDDASHIGSWSLASHSALLPHLKPGGLYIVEDWTTGYWDDWPDGGRYQRFTQPTDGLIAKRLPSHDFGMVGFVKMLVDEVSWQAIRPTRAAPRTQPRKLEYMHVHPGVVVLKKALS